MNVEQATLAAQVIPVIALAAVVEVRGILSQHRDGDTDIAESEPGRTATRAHSSLGLSTPASTLRTVVLAFLVFALTILSSGETKALLVVFGFGSDLGSTFMHARSELVYTLIVATNLIFLAPAGQALAAILAAWNRSAAEAPGVADSARKGQAKRALRLCVILILLMALYTRVIILA
jgi:hypothetical protein